MGDLINRKDVTNIANSFTFTSSDDRKHYMDFLNYCLYNTPITYNVDAIVKEIKDIGTRFCENIHCNDECECCDHDSIMKTIIGVVRNGGME